MAQNVVYYGIFIDKESKNKLKSLVPRTAYKVYCDHMTLAHSSTFTDDVVNTCNGLLGKEFTITATTIGKSKDAMAVGIETDCFSVNNHKHITLCTMTPSSKPVQSNYIENWAKLKKPIILKGTVMAFTNNGLVKENKTMDKKFINLTENSLNKIIKESIDKVLTESLDDDRFSIDMHKLYKAMEDEIGKESIRNAIASWFWKDWNGESKVVPCKFDDRGMFYLAYALCNYDTICLDDNGVVDLRYSNNPKIARLIKPYLSQENGMRIVHNLYGR